MTDRSWKKQNLWFFLFKHLILALKNVNLGVWDLVGSLKCVFLYVFHIPAEISILPKMSTLLHWADDMKCLINSVKNSSSKKKKKNPYRPTLFLFSPLRQYNNFLFFGLIVNFKNLWQVQFNYWNLKSIKPVNRTIVVAIISQLDLYIVEKSKNSLLHKTLISICLKIILIFHGFPVFPKQSKHKQVPY